jgi:hypothetical protein
LAARRGSWIGARSSDAATIATGLVAIEAERVTAANRCFGARRKRLVCDGRSHQIVDRPGLADLLAVLRSIRKS